MGSGAADSPPSRNGVGLAEPPAETSHRGDGETTHGRDTSSTRGAAASAAMIHLNIPVLVAGVRVNRDAEREDADDGGETNDAEAETTRRRESNDAKEAETTRRRSRSSTPLSTPHPSHLIPGFGSSPGPGYSFATWRLVKGFARFVEGDCDGRRGGRAPSAAGRISRDASRDGRGGTRRERRRRRDSRRRRQT